MKRIYSLILLSSFLIGTLQPILPMVEYQLYKGNVSALMDSGERISDQVADYLKDGLLFCITKTADAHEGESDPLLLDDDYYPIAVDIATLPAPHIIPNTPKLYRHIAESVTDPTLLPNPPPPRLS